jgi:hypothetical protein
MIAAGTILRSGAARGLIEFRQAFSGVELIGQLFWPLVTLAAIYFFRDRSIDDSGVSLDRIRFGGVGGPGRFYWTEFGHGFDTTELHRRVQGGCGILGDRRRPFRRGGGEEYRVPRDDVRGDGCRR